MKYLMEKLGTKQTSWLSLALFFISGILVGYALLQYLEGSKVDLIIDAKISKGNKIEIIINNNKSLSHSNTIYPGVRHLYIFENVPKRLNRLHLEPSDVKNAEISIYNIEFRKNGKSIHRIKPFDIVYWNHLGLRLSDDIQGNRLKVVSTSKNAGFDHYLYLNFLPENVRNLSNIRWNSGPVIDLICLLIACLIIMFIFFHKSYWKASFLATLMAGSYLVIWLVYGLAIKSGGNIPDVQNTVGQASFFGIEKESEINAFWLTVLATAIFVTAASFCWKLMEKKFNFPVNGEKPERSKNRYSFLFLGFVIIFLALLTFPDLSSLYNSTGNLVHSSGYDEQNMETWAYFRHLGLMPFRDFWYPYSGFFYAISPLPPDSLFFWFHKILLFGVSFFSIYVLLGFSKARTLSVLFFMFWMILLGFFGSHVFQKATFRYCMSLSVVLIYAASVNSKKMLPFFFVGAYMFYIFFMETTQLVYAAPSCILILIVSLILSKDTSERIKQLKHSTIALVTTITFIGLYMTYLSSQDALTEYIMFYRTLGDLASYCMAPTTHYLEAASNNFMFVLLELLLVVCMFSLLTLSLWNLFSGRAKHLEVRDFVPLAVALIVLMAFQKLIIRPMNISLDLIGLPTAGLALLATNNNFMKIRGGGGTRSILALIAGSLFYFLVIANGSAERVWNENVSKILKLPHNIGLALKGPSYWKEVEASRYLPSVFTIDNRKGGDLRTQFLEKMQFDKEDDLFVLGDDSYIYILLEKTAPFYITFYNQSILYSQQNTVDWLKKHKPKYVVWKSSFKEFDKVPNIVRVPLIFKYVINNYTYNASVGGFIILRRKDPLEQVDTDFWRQQLGDTVHLGLIPSRSDPDRFKADKDNTKRSYTILTIESPKPIHGKERTILVKVQNGLFKIKYRERKNVFSYNIILDRIWFWQLIQNPNDFKIPELTSRVRKIGLSKDILY